MAIRLKITFRTTLRIVNKIKNSLISEFFF